MRTYVEALFGGDIGGPEVVGEAPRAHGSPMSLWKRTPDVDSADLGAAVFGDLDRGRSRNSARRAELRLAWLEWPTHRSRNSARGPPTLVRVHETRPASKWLRKEVMTMTTLKRRDPFAIELPDWMERFIEERPWRRIDDVVGASAIRMEEFMDDGMLVVRAEMPGLDIDKDLAISLHDGLLHIKAQRTQKEEKKDKEYFRSEFRYGEFERTLPLPPGVTVADVKATYTDGVVEVRIPAGAPADGTTKVPVQRV